MRSAAGAHAIWKSDRNGEEAVKRKPTVERAGRRGTLVAPSAAERDCVQHREDLLDDALKETFPASDPPSIARPTGKGC